MSRKRQIQPLMISIALISVLAACATPRIQPIDPQVFLNSELAFIKDGIITREEVALKLGVPTAQLEVDRILMYQFRAGEDGKWHLVSPKFSGRLNNWGLREWEKGTMSLVLAFDAAGILQKHSMVVSQ